MTESTDATPGWRDRLALIAVVGLAAGLRLWQLEQNGYGREYYAAAVRSMMGGLRNFLFNSFDPAGFVSLDKPPVAMWMQVASAKLLGFGPFSTMLPQVLEGVLAVVLVHRIVGRRFGQAAALTAALVLALTPISVAVDRSNNTDSCLLLVLLLAAWAAIVAAERASWRWLMAAMALVGIGFNVKMAAAWVVAPAFGLAYLVGATAVTPLRRCLHLAAAGVVLIGVSLSWVTAFDLTAPDARPYAGSTKHNSMLELALRHNAADRFVYRPPREAAPEPAEAGTALWDHTPAGPLRLVTPRLAAQFAWLLPFAIAGVWLFRRRGATTPTLVVLAGWAAIYGVVLSFAGGLFHTYYLSALAPPLAALSGIGLAALWHRHRDGAPAWQLPVILGSAAVWQIYLTVGGGGWRPEDWRGWLLLASLAGLAGAAAMPMRRPALPLALAALLALPAAWASSVVLVRPNVAAPAADIAAFDRPQAEARRSAGRKLVQFLKQNRGEARFLVAVPNALQAAPIIVRTGEPVMAMGGYLGRDPILTPDALDAMARRGELRFVILGGFRFVPVDTPAEQAVVAWVRAHGKPVDPALWREGSGAAPRGRASLPVELYEIEGQQAERRDMEDAGNPL